MPEYVEQSWRELALKVCDRPLALNQFQVLTEERGFFDALMVRWSVAVVASSHVVFLEHRRQALTEALSCREIPTANRQLAVSAPVGNEMARKVSLGPFAYRFEFSIHPTGDDGDGLWSRLAEPDRRSIEGAFPQSEDAPSAKTRVQIWHEDREVCWATAHWYPAEGVIAVSRSRVRLDSGGP